MRLSVVIPAYNEAATLNSVVRGFYEALVRIEDSFEIVVVDNGSTDGTAGVLDKIKGEIPQMRSIRVFPNKGYGNGILAGLEITTGNVIGWVHADSQLNAQDLVRVYEKLRAENLDFCKVTRAIRQESPVRIAGSKIYNAFFRLLFGDISVDVNASPKLFGREWYEKLHLESRDWFIDAEVLLKMKNARANIGEVPITWYARKEGASSVHIGTWLQFIKNMFIYRFFK